MSNQKKYHYYMYLAGIRVPLIDCTIGTQIGSIAQLSINLNYSPFIIHLYEFTKIQIYEQMIDNGIINEPTLEFDGVIISVTKSKNILGQVSATLVALTDGIIWNRRKQYDVYLQNVLNADFRGTLSAINVRADGNITNFYADILQKNNFDIGCAVSSVLTSSQIGEKKTGDSLEYQIHGYDYYYNGKHFKKSGSGSNINPKYYNKFFEKYKLHNKVYGIATSKNVQEYFQVDRIIRLITNEVQDIQGENTFWNIAQKVMQYGFYNIYDIPNPTFLGISKPTKNEKAEFEIGVDLIADTKADVDNKDYINQDRKLGKSQSKLVCTKNRQYNGLAEYILKPISVLGIPLKCNIIWPDQVISESLTYDFFNSPTRVLLKSSPIPDPNAQNDVLCSVVFAGPVFQNNNNFLGSYIPSKEKYTEQLLRQDNSYSNFEEEYGINYSRLELSYAFDNALLQRVFDPKMQSENEEVKKKTITYANNFLNYEFSQKYFSSRQYSVQVNPEVNIIPGSPVIFLDRTGQHIVAFCTGLRKSWSINGSKTVVLSVAYPRYYYEDIGNLGNLIDPTSSNAESLAELETLLGSTAITPTDKNSMNDLADAIDKIYKEYIADKSDGHENIKNKYKRTGTCTYYNFMTLHGKAVIDKKVMPDSYDLFASDTSEDKLTCHTFRVTDENGIVKKYNGTNGQAMTLRGIIQNHIDWTKEGKRI